MGHGTENKAILELLWVWDDHCLNGVWRVHGAEVEKIPINCHQQGGYINKTGAEIRPCRIPTARCTRGKAAIQERSRSVLHPPEHR